MMLEVMIMKLIGNLKDQVEKANSLEEAKGFIEKAGMQLTEDELNMVAGGAGIAPAPRRPGSGHLPTWVSRGGNIMPPSYHDASKSEMEKIRESYIDR